MHIHTISSILEGISHTMDNPLLNPLVVGEVLGLLERGDLVVARQVCSLWEEEASRILRRELTLHFHDLCQVTSLRKVVEGGRGGEEEGKRRRTLPFARVSLRTSFRLGHPMAQDFFGRYGRMLSHVGVGKVGGDCGLNLLGRLLFLQATEVKSLAIAILATPLRLTHPVDDMPPLLPNLRVLVLRHQLFLERLPFVQDLLKAVPNLQELSTDLASPSFVANVFIPTLMETWHLWKHLRHIHSPPLTFTGPAQLVKWVERAPPLRSLRLHFNHSRRNLCSGEASGNSLVVAETGFLQTWHVRMLLQVLQGTLTNLELNNQGTLSSFSLDEALPLAGLPLVDKLSVTNVLVEGRKVFPRLPRLRDLSVLVEEEFTGPGMELQGFSLAPLVTRVSLQTPPGEVFAAKEWWEVNASHFVIQVTSTFPFIRDLRVWGGSDTFLQEVFTAQFAPVLESLEVHGFVSDAGLTGLSSETCRRMHVTQDYTLKDDEIPQGFIGDLPRLRRLVVLPPEGPKSPQSTPLLTEVCVFFGLMSCRDLVTLDIQPPEVLKLWKDEKDRAMVLHNLTSSSRTRPTRTPTPSALIQSVSTLRVFSWRIILPLYGLVFASLLSIYLG